MGQVPKLQASLLRWGWITTGWVPHNRRDNNFNTLKVQKNLHSSMEKTRRCCEHLQHPWACKSRDLLTQPKQKIQEEAGGQGGTAHSCGTKPLLPAGRLWQVLPQSLAWEKNIMRPLCLLVTRELEEDKGILFVQGGGGGEAHLAVPGGR